MKRVIVTLLLVLALVGIGINAFAADNISVPAYSDYIVVGNPPAVDTNGAKTPDIMGSWE